MYIMSPASILCSQVAALFLVRFVESLSYEENGVGNKRRSSSRSTTTINVTQINNLVDEEKGYDIVVHGIVLWASMGFLMPVGILTMRISSTMDSQHHPSRHKFFFYVHAILQVMSVVLATVGAVLSIRKFENAFNNTHQRIGLALYGAMYLQVLIGFKRPKRGTKYRTAWYLLHWILGTSTCLVGILNVYTGLQAFRERTTSRRTTLWTIIFTAQVSFMTIFYLFQDKWEYIQKQQGRMLVTDGDHSHRRSDSCTGAAAAAADSQKQVVIVRNESFRKSNALASHFSRTNVLNKLFQQA